MKKFLLLPLLWLSYSAMAQTILLIDKTTREPLPGQIIYTKEPIFSAITNQRGQIQIQGFKDADSIFVNALGYLPLTISFKDIETNKYMIELIENPVSLSEISITANRWEEEEKENAFRIEKLKMKDMDLQNPQTTADLLGAGSSVYIQKSQQAGGSPMLRGFGTNRVMLVIDGVRMNNAIFRSGNVQNVISLDANAMESVEVLFGPGAVMYGSDAIGGVMDFHTKTARFSDSNKVFIKANALARYSTANQENTGHMDLNIGFKKIAFATSFTYAKYDDLMAGTQGGDSVYQRPFYQVVKQDKDTQVVNPNPSLQVNSKYSQINFMQKVAYAPTKNFMVDYAFHHSESGNALRYDRLITDANSDKTLDFSEWYYGPQIWQMHRLALKHNANNLLYNNIRLIVAYQHFEESRHDRRFNASGSATSGNARLRHQYEKLDAYSANLDLDKKIGENTHIFYGSEFVFNKVDSKSNRINVYTGADQKLNPRYPDGSTWQTTGAYINLKQKIKDKFIVNGGLRYTFYKIKALFDTTLFVYPITEANTNSGALNGSLGFVYAPSKKWQIYSNASTGFRAPNIDDIGKVFDSQPGNVVVPNPDLKPEYAYNVEVGTAAVFGNFLKVDAALYYTYLTNALVRRPFTYNGNDSIIYNGVNSRVFALQNANNAFVYGVQNGVEIYFGHGISIRNNITLQVGKENNQDSSKYYPLSHATPLFGNTHLMYAAKKIKADLYVMYNGKMTYDDLPLSERLEPYIYARTSDKKPYVPAWYTLNFKVTYFINKYFAINGGVENIADKLYRPFASGISAPGRNFIISLRYKM